MAVKYYCPRCRTDHPKHSKCPRFDRLNIDAIKTSTKRECKNCGYKHASNEACPMARKEKPGSRPEYNRLYRTSWWLRVRLGVLADQPFCQCGSPAIDVDHIKPHHGDREVFFDITNLQAMCHSCHSEKTAEESRR